MKYFGLLLLCFFMLFSCEKDEHLEKMNQEEINLSDCFFDNDCLSIRKKSSFRGEGEDYYSGLLRAYFMDNPKEKEKVEKKYGIPVWDYLDIFYVEGKVLLYTPLIEVDGTNTNAVLLTLIGDQNELGFNIIERKKINQYLKVDKNKNKQDYITKELSLLTTMYFDNLIFDYTDCNLVDLLKSITSNARNTIKTRDEVCEGEWVEKEEVVVILLDPMGAQAPYNVLQHMNGR